MPQDKRRSISYRTFVTCDNPKGVVECGTIRKSKIINSQKKEQQIQQQQHNFKVVVESDKKLGNNLSTTNNNSSLGDIIKEDKKKMCIKDVTSELDLLKSGEKMNHVINSWNNKGEGGCHEQDIAKDLLRGAFDLQESLVMLGKLQEEAFLSFNMSRLRRKEKVKVVEQGTFDCMVNGVVSEKLHNVGFQRPRKSTDEMKNAVRDSLLRQNMIMNPIFEENFDCRMMGGCSNMASTSSSRSSSVVRSSNFVASDSSASSSSVVSQRPKKKESNLIVRLMGLESPPLSPRWNIQKPVFDVDSPRGRKCQYGEQVFGKKQRSVEEILESLNFKGLLRSSSMNVMKPNSVESDVFPKKNGWYDERPPIVVMKPMSYNARVQEETNMPMFSREGITKPTFSRLSVEGTVSEEGRKSVKRDGFYRGKNSMNQEPKPQMKREALRKTSEAEKARPKRQKGEENEDAGFRDQVKPSNAARMIKQKDGRLISKQQNSISSTSVIDHRKQEISEISGQRKKNRQPSFVEENKKGKHKGKEKEIEVLCKEKTVSTCDDNNNVFPVAKSMIFDSFLEKKLSRNQIRDYNVEASIEHRQNDKMSIYDIAPADTNGYDDNHSCYSEITSVSTSDQYSPAYEVTLVTTHENGVPVHNHGNKSPSFPCENEPEKTPKTNLQTLLLSNPLFLANLEKHFEIQVFPDQVPYDVARDNVLIDYANEVMHLKSLELSQPYSPQKWIHTKKTRNLPSLDQLLEDIRNDIEGLKRYHDSVKDDTFSSDSLYLILDRDLSFKSTGVWEIGWRKMFSRHEVELVVREVDKFIIGKLIEEVVSDFMVQ